MPSLLTACFLPVGKLLVDLCECLGMGRHVTAEPEYQASAGGNQPSGEVNQLLDDSLDPATLGFVANDPLVFNQAYLTDKAQDVVLQGAAGHDQLVRGKLS